MPEATPTKGSLNSLREDAIPPFNTETGGVGIASAFQMILALVVVVLLVKFLVPKFLGKMFKKTSTDLGPDFETIQTTQIGGQQMHLVKVRNKTLLLGTSQHGLNLIADLTEEQTVYNLPVVEKTDSHETVDNFDDMLERLKRLSG